MEKDVAQHFKEIFQDYLPQVITNHALAGWPDRMLQLPNSIAIFVEIKHIIVPATGQFRIPLRQEQAVWLGKWQMNGGLCFLFLGLGHKFGVLSMQHWKSWLRVPRTIYRIYDFQLVFENGEQVLQWFRIWSKLRS